MSTVPVSVVINTLNEERNLPYALRSVRWAAEVVVCDMHSDDRTAEIAREFGARVVLHERLGFADPARAFAIGQATHEWVLVLDADELISRKLADTIARLVVADEADIYRLPRLNYLLGAPLERLGWGPDVDAQLRLFKKSAVRITPDIHDFFHVREGARSAQLRYAEAGGIVHFNYVDLSHFIEKLNRYASIEAKQAFARGERASIRRALLAAAREWGSRYLRAGGVREGWRGFYLAAMMSMYRLAIQGKLAELETGNSTDEVKRRYVEEAERYLHEYEPNTGSQR
ncbi:MAG: glycosyltransferase family 2 protein [Myxococcota bacterium]